MNLIKLNKVIGTIFLFLLVSFKIYSQEIVTRDEIYYYVKDSLTYKVETDEPFTGKIQHFKHKNHLLSESQFSDGILLKSIVYFNGKEVIISRERYYYKKSREIDKEVSYSLDHKTIRTTYYEKNGDKKLEEDFNDGILIYRCPYVNNKKNGTLFSINKKGEKRECIFENGKVLKSLIL